MYLFGTLHVYKYDFRNNNSCINNVVFVKFKCLPKLGLTAVHHPHCVSSNAATL